jgi:hypothetical protein
MSLPNALIMEFTAMPDAYQAQPRNLQAYLEHVLAAEGYATTTCATAWADAMRPVLMELPTLQAHNEFVRRKRVSWSLVADRHYVCKDGALFALPIDMGFVYLALPDQDSLQQAVDSGLAFHLTLRGERLHASASPHHHTSLPLPIDNVLL